MRLDEFEKELFGDLEVDENAYTDIVMLSLLLKSKAKSAKRWFIDGL